MKTSDRHRDPPVHPEQMVYARILEVGMYLGLVLLLATFVLYLTGLMAPGVPVEKLPDYWRMSADEYLQATNADHLHRAHPVTGWSWLALLHKADYLNFVGIVLLSAVTIVCFLGIIPTLVRRKDWVYAGMALLEAVILALAASGILNFGH